MIYTQRIQNLLLQILLKINSWQSKYDDAKEMYDSTMSMSVPEQRNLDYAKDKMDEAQKEINALKREIDLKNCGRNPISFR